MSFILDALRKSEHERQRKAGPALADVPVAATRSRTNTWATAAIALLVVNLAALGLLLLRKANEAPASTASLPEAAAKATEPALPAAPPVPPATMVQGPAEPPPMLRPAVPAPAGPVTGNPLAEEVSGSLPAAGPQFMADATGVPAGPPAVTRAPTGGGTVVYETLPEADPVGPRRNDPPAPTASGLPTADEVAASGSVPELRLELHVYSSVPTDRFAFINSRKYREGDTLQEGPQVEEITRDGVVLGFRGRRFLLPRE